MAPNDEQGQQPQVQGDIAPEKPLQLFNQLTLSGPTSITLTATSPITLDHLGGLQISSSAPITFTSSSKKLLKIQCASPLGSEFQRGWDNLPNELKERVMEFMVVQDGPILVNSWRQYLEPCLHLTPEMASLAKAVFCKRNLFRLHLFDDRSRLGGLSLSIPHNHPRMSYPGPKVHTLIRRMNVSVQFDSTSWSKLRKLADGVYGFTSLRQLEIKVDLKDYRFSNPNSLPAGTVGGWRARREWEKWAEELTGPSMVFDCAGSIRIARDLNTLHILDGHAAGTRAYHRFNKLLAAKVRFSGA